MKRLRTYQSAMAHEILNGWNSGARVVVGCTGTGSGKTVVKAAVAQMLQGEGIIQAHRGELVGQISTAMGDAGLRHNIIASTETIRTVVDKHMDELGYSMYDPRAKWTVASTDTLVKRSFDGARFKHHFIDEGHHVLRENKWGKTFASTPNAKGLLMTATTYRADGKGLSAETDGIADMIVHGPGLGDLVRDGYLVSYDVAAAKAEDLDLEGVEISAATGDLVVTQMRTAVKRSRKIITDAVAKYRQYADGKQAIVFAADIEHGATLLDEFKRHGIAAAMVHGESKDRERNVKAFRLKSLQVLVNVDLFGEGFDVPGVECVVMARPTASFALFCQMVGRMLRLDIEADLRLMWDDFTVEQRLIHIAASRKPKAVLIDLVGNIYNSWKVGPHDYKGLPEGFRAWGIDRRNKRASKPADGIPLRRCMGLPADPMQGRFEAVRGCGLEYVRTLDACPFCDVAAPEPAERSTIQQVDGNVLLLDPAVLAAMRGEVKRIDGPCYLPAGMSPVAARAATINHHERQLAQHHLRDAIAHWAGRHAGRSQAELSRLFYYTFGIDVINAVSLGKTDADALRAKIGST